MLPNVPPKLFSFSAVVVGYILIDDMTANEQNALGNWLMLVAQVLSTNAFYRAVMQERGLEPRESTETGRNNSYTFGNDNNNNNYNFNQNECNETVEMLEKMVRAMQQEICDIKKNISK
ncbi:MAG: hypothetical protein IJY87_01000 [Bacilli bacterium]|nr:hypothetical protein [Bacilli bacterium]